MLGHSLNNVQHYCSIHAHHFCYKFHRREVEFYIFRGESFPNCIIVMLLLVKVIPILQANHNFYVDHLDMDHSENDRHGEITGKKKIIRFKMSQLFITILILTIATNFSVFTVSLLLSCANDETVKKHVIIIKWKITFDKNNSFRILRRPQLNIILT